MQNQINTPLNRDKEGSGLSIAYQNPMLGRARSKDSLIPL